MKKLLVYIAAAACVCAPVFAQQQQSATPAPASIAEPNPAIIGADSAKQSLKEVSVDKFESEGSWNAKISSDDGIISARLFEGGPAGKEPAPDEADKNLPDKTVLCVKAEFFRRGNNTFYVTAARPVPIEGVTKTVSVWVAGRNYNHKLYLLVQDYFGSNFELYVDKLNFSGWKKLTVAIPPSPDGKRGIIQSEPHYGDRPGLRIVGFKIECDPEEAYGSYYIYFDDLRAVTDLYAIENRNLDDMVDNW